MGPAKDVLIPPIWLWFDWRFEGFEHIPVEGPALATGVSVIPLTVWGSGPVWQRDGRRSMRLGRPIWVKAGPPLDFSEYEGRAEDPGALRTVTDEIMAQLSLLVDDLRERYPKRWAA